MDEAGRRSSTNALPRVEVQDIVVDEGPPPPLPPRPNSRERSHHILYNPESSSKPRNPSRPQLQSSATTALSLTDIHIQTFQDGSRETFDAQAEPTASGRLLKGFDSIRRLKGHSANEADCVSVRSYAPTLEAGGDMESLLGEVLATSPGTRARTPLGTHAEVFGTLDYEDDENISHFEDEFDELEELSVDADNEGERC